MTPEIIPLTDLCDAIYGTNWHLSSAANNLLHFNGQSFELITKTGEGFPGSYLLLKQGNRHRRLWASNLVSRSPDGQHAIIVDFKPELAAEASERIEAILRGQLLQIVDILLNGNRTITFPRSMRKSEDILQPLADFTLPSWLDVSWLKAVARRLSNALLQIPSLGQADFQGFPGHLEKVIVELLVENEFQIEQIGHPDAFPNTADIYVRHHSMPVDGYFVLECKRFGVNSNLQFVLLLWIRNAHGVMVATRGKLFTTTLHAAPLIYFSGFHSRQVVEFDYFNCQSYIQGAGASRDSF
jgi:hypothetical protein